MEDLLTADDLLDELGRFQKKLTQIEAHLTSIRREQPVNEELIIGFACDMHKKARKFARRMDSLIGATLA